MKIDVWTHDTDSYEVEAIVSAGLAEGIDIRRRIYTDVEMKGQVVIYADNEYVPGDAMVMRSPTYRGKPNSSEIFYEILKVAKLSGSYVLNEESYYRYPKFDKLTQFQAMDRSGMDTIETILVERARMRGLEFPLIIKPVAGSRGRGVVKVESYEDIEDYLRNTKERCILQPVMRLGLDYRIMVVGSALGAMEKKAGEGKLTTNVNQGGITNAVVLPEEAVELAKDACRIFGLEYAGVDLIQSEEGKWYVLEINRFADFRGFTKTTGVNVGKKVVDYLVSNAS